MKKLLAYGLTALLAAGMLTTGAMAGWEEFGGAVASVPSDTGTGTQQTGENLPQAEYSGVEVDPFTGKLVSEQNYETDWVTLTGSCAYDRTNNLFVYSVGSAGRSISSSAFDGMVGNGPVSIVYDTGTVPVLFRNGTVVQNPDWSNITEPGAYVVAASGTGVSSRLFTFTIVEPKTNQLKTFTVPSYIRITAVSRDDEPVSSGQNELTLQEDGTYVISCYCPEADWSYSFTTTLDTVAPVLALEAVNEKGYATGPVSLADAEPGCTVSIMRDGEDASEEFDTSKLQLTKSGSYELRISDEAGNSSLYFFVIRIYLNLEGWVMVSMVLLILVGALGYMIWTRKRLKVR